MVRIARVLVAFAVCFALAGNAFAKKDDNEKAKKEQEELLEKLKKEKEKEQEKLEKETKREFRLLKKEGSDGLVEQRNAQSVPDAGNSLVLLAAAVAATSGFRVLLKRR
jgi:hypothetical protein